MGEGLALANPGSFSSEVCCASDQFQQFRSRQHLISLLLWTRACLVPFSEVSSITHYRPLQIIFHLAASASHLQMWSHDCRVLITFPSMPKALTSAFKARKVWSSAASPGDFLFTIIILQCRHSAKHCCIYESSLQVHSNPKSKTIYNLY